MSIKNLHRLFRPESVAVIGGSHRPGSFGAVVMRNLIDGGFSGDIYPVNPRHHDIMGYPSFSGVDKIPPGVDLGIAVTRIDTLPRIVKECAASGMAGLIIVSAGGKENGARGGDIEDAIQKAAAGSELRIVGPNCMGLINTRQLLNASVSQPMPIVGKTAFISQSGAICASILDLATSERIGFSHVISLGSMRDVNFGDIIDYLGGDPHVSSIVMYVECLTHFRSFMSAARAVSRVKPIVALKAGRTSAGAIAAASHTGAVTGIDAIYDAAFRRAGIVRVRTFEELFDCSGLLARQPQPAGNGLAVITNAGGPGVMAVDMLQDYGQQPAVLSEETLRQLDEILPPFRSRANPVDIMGDASPERYVKTVDICLNAPEVGGVLILFSPLNAGVATPIAEALCSSLREKHKSVITSWSGGDSVDAARRIFHHAGIPTFDTPERAVRAFMNLYRYARNIEVLQEIPPKFHRRLNFNRESARKQVETQIRNTQYQLNETASKSVLSDYGIPVNPTVSAASADEAIRKADEMGYPVVMKIASADISHKSNLTGVHLDIRNAPEVRRHFESITAHIASQRPDVRISGVTLQPMVTQPHHELLIGAHRDPDFGPVLVFGVGGVLTEALRDHAFALPPINRHLAKICIAETRISQVLQGFRNLPAVAPELLEEILMRVSELVVDIEHIESLDINPLMIGDTWASAVDARILLKPSPVPSPLHLVISPYPNQLENTVYRDGCGELTIRPIRPEDAPLLLALYESLSPRSVYMRFFTPMRSFQHSMLVRFTQIDYDREIALVAVQENDGRESMLGVSRIIMDVTPDHGEFAVLLSDTCHGKGIGAELLGQCLMIAKERKIRTVMGVVLSENTQMLALGKKLGFKIATVSGGGEYELTIHLEELRSADILKACSRKQA